jgi:hypothetical protein
MEFCKPRLRLYPMLSFLRQGFPTLLTSQVAEVTLLYTTGEFPLQTQVRGCAEGRIVPTRLTRRQGVTEGIGEDSVAMDSRRNCALHHSVSCTLELRFA